MSRRFGARKAAIFICSGLRAISRKKGSIFLEDVRGETDGAAFTDGQCRSGYINFLVIDLNVSPNLFCYSGWGEVQKFGTLVTAPAASTIAADNIVTTSSTLNGTFNDNGTTTTVNFKDGTTTSYGSTATASPSSIAAHSGSTAVSAALVGLSPSTLYLFRVDATNVGRTEHTACCPWPSFDGPRVDCGNLPARLA